VEHFEEKVYSEQIYNRHSKTLS